MKTISSKDILTFLNDKEILFECDHELEDNYILASIFIPVEKGFYFFVGDKVPSNISNSVLLLNKDNYEILSNNNIGIYLLNEDPQRVFYRFLISLFRTEANGIIASTAIIHPEATIGKNVQIDHFTVVEKATIKDNVIIKSHCYIHDNSSISENVTIENHSIIGSQGVAWIWNKDETEKIVQTQIGGVEIGKNSFLGANTIVVRGSLNENTIIGNNTLLAPGCRLGHGTQIGDYVHFANNVVTGGNVKIEDYTFVGSGAIFRPKVKVDERTIVGSGAVIVKNTTEAGKTLVGIPAKEKKTKAHPSGMPKPKSKRKNNS